MSLIYGVPIQANPSLPAVKRRYDFDPTHQVPVSDECRARMEAWAREFFRATPFVLQMKDPWTGRDLIVAHPSVVAQIRGMSKALDAAMALGEVLR